MRSALASLTLLLICSIAHAADEPKPDTNAQYKLGPDSLPHEGVPKGKVEKFSWTSKIFDGTVRDCWVYIPAQYDGKQRAAVMVFQDGGGYVNVGETGAWRVPNVFDNLIAKKEMPVTVGIFLNPGTFPPQQASADGKPTKGASNRSFEYDTLSDQYSRFLIEEILPEVAKKLELKLTEDPEGRAIGGLSSGGICSFTVAWQRPDAFRKVASFIGSYTGIAYRPAQGDKPMQPGGDLYPTLIRKTPIKPLKVFLQDGSNDLDNEHGAWFLANQQMLAALNYANAKADKDKSPGPRYLVDHAWGEGTHNPRHGGSIFPGVMRWMWKDYKPKE